MTGTREAEHESFGFSPNEAMFSIHVKRLLGVIKDPRSKELLELYSGFHDPDGDAWEVALQNLEGGPRENERLVRQERPGAGVKIGK